MGANIDLNAKFLEYFNEIEGFSLRGERFYSEFESGSMSKESVLEWLKAAFLRGARDMAQDTVDTLGDYATALAGIDEVVYTREQAYDAAAESLMVYYTRVLDNSENG